jgi:hypothetical protein
MSAATGSSRRVAELLRHAEEPSSHAEEPLRHASEVRRHADERFRRASIDVSNSVFHRWQKRTTFFSGGRLAFWIDWTVLLRRSFSG